MELRQYQKDAMNAVLREWDGGENKKVLIVLGTGCGKTIIFSNVAKKQVEKGHRVLILAHRGELLTQAQEKLKAATGLDSALEKAEHFCLGSPERVVVGSIQSISREDRLCSFPKDYFQTIIIDEAHHCMSESYQRVLSYFNDAYVLGVTATPDRGDMKKLNFDCLAYEYNMINAIKDGWLSKIMARTIPLKIDITGVSLSAGDYSPGELGETLDPYLKAIAKEMKTYCAGRKTLVFTPLIKTSIKLCEYLQLEGLNAAEVNGESKNRTQIIKDFEDGMYDVVCNSMLLTEGFDSPAVDCIVCLRATKSKSLFTQIVGRGTRLFPGKDHLLLLDFLWLTRKLGVCHPSSLVCSDEEIAAEMDEMYQKGGEAKDILLMEGQARANVTKKMEASLAAYLAAQRKKEGSITDPLQFVASVGALGIYGEPSVFKWEDKPATKKQLEFLKTQGIDVSKVSTKGQASKLISLIVERRNKGYSTPKQIRLLERLGFDRVGTWKFEKASSCIDEIAKMHWKVTPIIKSKYDTLRY